MRTWQGGRTAAWVAVAGLVVAAVSLWHDVATEEEPGAFTVLELSADSSREIPATEQAAPDAPKLPTTTEATVLAVGLKNDTSSLRTFKQIGIRNKGQVSVTPCGGGSGGGTVFTATYEVDLPPVGKTALTQAPHGHNFEPKKAEAFHLTLGSPGGTDDLLQAGGVYALEVFLVEDNGHVFEAGKITVAETPAVATQYPMDLSLLQLSSYPDEKCVRKTAAGIKKLADDGYPLSDQVKNLHAGLLKTADELATATP
ncbi:hypothetical protein [Streptomyces sp. NPDC089919]|uniref:hypothetical protein n=1 Tax=Streptomyces sp. NPDC089919 TaxID=3155188 RepID=UPI00341EDF79